MRMRAEDQAARHHGQRKLNSSSLTSVNIQAIFYLDCLQNSKDTLPQDQLQSNHRLQVANDLALTLTKEHNRVE